jgi:hypothetical protein
MPPFAFLLVSVLGIAGCPPEGPTWSRVTSTTTTTADAPPGPVGPVVLGASFAPHRFGRAHSTLRVGDATGEGTASIDWTRGVMEVSGVGYEPPRAASAAQRQIAAIRAARVAAIRNAVRLGAWVAADPDRSVAQVGLPAGSGRLQAFVLGFSEVGAPQQFKAPDGRVAYRIKIEVPLWGVRGLAAAAFAGLGEPVGEARYTLVTAQPGSEPTVRVDCVVIDARGLPLRPVLWGRITDPQGKVLYDRQTIRAGGGRMVLHYTRSKAPAAELEAPAPATQPAAATQPATRPAVRRVVVRAISESGRLGGGLVIRTADAEVLAASPQSARALRAGRVVVLTDARLRGQ